MKEEERKNDFWCWKKGLAPPNNEKPKICACKLMHRMLPNNQARVPTFHFTKLAHYRNYNFTSFLNKLQF